MAVDLKALGLDKLTGDEMRELADALWEKADANVETEDTVPPGYELTPELIAELDRRIADAEANPDDYFTREEVQESIRKRLGR